MKPSETAQYVIVMDMTRIHISLSLESKQELTNGLSNLDYCNI